MRFERNKRLINGICSAYSAKTLFFLQPHPFYKYNLKLFRPELLKPILEGNNFDIVKAVYDSMRRNGEFIDISTYEKWPPNKKIFLDDYHYSPAFNKFLAEQIASYVNLDTLKVMPEVFNESEEKDIVRLTQLNSEF